MNVWILANEDAGRGLSHAALRELIEDSGHTLCALLTTFDADSRPPHGDDIDLIVSAGGDGTAATVAAIAARTSIPMAILPLGTANNIAGSLGVGKDIPQLIAGWDRARHVPLDIGQARAGTKQWTVVEGVGSGLIPAGIAAAERILTRPDAHPVVEVATAVEIFYDVLKNLEPVRRTIIVDGARISEPLLMVEVLNISAVGPNVVLAPDASPSDGEFDVILAGERHRTALLDYLESRKRNQPHELSLPCHRARRVRFESCDEVHIDDERVDMVGWGDVEIVMEAGAATVLV